MKDKEGGENIPCLTSTGRKVCYHGGVKSEVVYTYNLYHRMDGVNATAVDGIFQGLF